MKVRELVKELLTKDQDEEILLCERECNKEGHVLGWFYYKIGDIEQWSTQPDESHHYTIFGGEFVSG